MTALVTALSSCASLKRVLQADTSNSAVSVEELHAAYKPAGRICEVWYDCSAQEGPARRRMLVYLPESYDRDPARRYPVLYLMHGARGNETSWITEGGMTSIMDSLWKEKLAVECLVVLCNMNQYDDEADFANSRFKRPFESFFETNGAVETYFVQDVVNLVDRSFRTIADKRHRAIAGLSVGGFQTIFISASNPTTFDYVGLFSAFFKGPVHKGRYSEFYDDILFKLTAQFKVPPKLYFIEIGYWDFFVVHNEYFRRYLTANNFTYEYIESSGGHTWDNWRQYLIDFTKKIF